MVALKTDVRMGPVGARIRHGEPVRKVTAGADVRSRGLGAIHIVAQRDAVPMHRRRITQTVGHRDDNLIPDGGPDQWSGDGVAVGQRADDRPTQVDPRRLGSAWR